MNLIKNIARDLYLRTPIEETSMDRVFDFAVRNVSYYRQFAGCKFEELPILTRDILFNEFESLKSDDLNKRKWFIKTSGGSTGQPVKLIQDLDYKKHQRFITYQQKSWCGYGFGEPMVQLWGSEKDIFESTSGKKSQIINRIKNITILNAFRMSEKNMKAYINTINEIKPKLLVAYVQPIFELAKFAENNHIEINPPEAIMTSAGTLFTFMKEQIEQVFKAPVFNRYGTREVGSIACSGIGFDNLRISDNNVYVEVLNANGESCDYGEEGEIVVTSLANFAMPIIRYKIGDIGVKARLTNSYPALKKVSGRITEVFRNIKGDIIPAEYFIHTIGVVLNTKNSLIRRFQVIQKEIDHILIKVILADKTGDKLDFHKIEELVRKVMGERCKVEIKTVDNIPLLKSGKFAYAINELK